ncbi:hypothetical protein BSL78_11687 [Apostichopus japonicus]|uniref:Uncharacterized protein n=1 Tax=Stichopus japonicus TaxID=307972 RepID=A0A2G8KTZ7_STIJA|nr:hypothetical protein BSL78_11687 [Apostichopus japonicus]
MPGVIVRPVEELLDGLHLDLTATNGIEVPYDGWVARTSLGTLEQVTSVLPLPQVLCKTSVDQTATANSTYVNCDIETDRTKPPDERQDRDWCPPVDLSDLTPDQRQLATKMLLEESSAFSRDDMDTGDCPDLQMKIQLKDETPVQKGYISIPRPLYKEVKEYLEDLIRRGWVSKSKSNYSSPVVCACESVMAHFVCALILEHSTRKQWMIDNQSPKSKIC